MTRTDQWHDERTEVITPHGGPGRPDAGHDRDGYVDPDRTEVVSGIATPDRDEPVHHEPVEQPTAFGAATVGGAVAASAMAGPERLHEPRDPSDDDTVRVGDGGEAQQTGQPEPAGIFAAEQADAFRDRWRDVQLRFVDDPHAAAGEAQNLVTEAVEALTAALTAQRDELGGWTDAGPEDTEQLRMAVRRYRDLLDRVLSN
ncbi:hypothetical protein O7543_12280 [Solwaraspora sp. WMMA2080]|uniref:hypothetical protein n=1 Tax=unclassified Solwaraspora TaxID=2627926 RepID=UPI00248A95EC|nr:MULTISPECIES: hypothetical protein [unclassified Solwaraspora]WBB98311.1 hypothetical protein O7553_05085 [Solwaraspora sp. WMMA2059]WBC23135.1 hypothetical protein O7543_12280 [Solwaraspora sp. WMMA2080]